jgi:hypothetical protein
LKFGPQDFPADLPCSEEEGTVAAADIEQLSSASIWDCSGDEPQASFHAMPGKKTVPLPVIAVGIIWPHIPRLRNRVPQPASHTPIDGKCFVRQWIEDFAKVGEQ